MWYQEIQLLSGFTLDCTSSVGRGQLLMMRFVRLFWQESRYDALNIDSVIPIQRLGRHRFERTRRATRFGALKLAWLLDLIIPLIVTNDLLVKYN